MASKYWIKLYQEILDDPKMGMLPAELWRFTIELFLLAGEIDCNGTLPNVTKIAWRLRYSVSQVETWLDELSKETGIVTNTKAGWEVTNFAKRQAASDVNERVKHFRERQKRQNEAPPPEVETVTESNETPQKRVTKKKRKVTPDTDTDKESKYPNGATPPLNGQDSRASPAQLMFGALAKVCKINWKVATNDQKGELNQSERILRVEVEAVPEDLPEFEKWWYKHDWRGKGGSPPTPSQVREVWQQFLDYREKSGAQKIIRTEDGGMYV